MYFLAVAVNLYLGKLHVVAVVVSSIDGTEFRDIGANITCLLRGYREIDSRISLTGTLIH